MYKILSYVFAAVIAVTSFLGIPVYEEETGTSIIAAELFENGAFINGEIGIGFDKQSVNTVEIELESSAPAEVKIYNGDELIYQRSSSDIYRFCAFRTVETDALTLEISGGVNVKSVTVSLKQSDNKDFRVTSYFVSQYVSEENAIAPEVFEVVTDAILFGCVTFDENAEMTVNKDLLEPSLANLRNAIGDKDVNVYINILGPGSDGGIDDWYEQMDNQAEKHSKVFKTKKLEGKIAALLDEYKLDGIFFDYEYPIDMKYWSDFSRFLVRLDKATDKKIGLAVAHWDIGLSYSAMKAVDMVEVMQYDLFDDTGNHSSFTSAVDGFNAVRDYLLPREKADLGVPFYGRPANAGAYWYNYNEYADKINTNDYAETEQGGTYFNSWQTIYDKTAYAISRGLGGMMVWHYSCDVDFKSDISLFAAMDDCIKDRIK
ncbi:MAG: glycoside hydrolase family 18 protein [Clostridia bacterium]|nr:glycoside hydrolase family 18 protein [Clostridia bacterium]